MSCSALIVITGHSSLGNTGNKTGWYLPEVSHVYYPLVAAGIKVDFASPKGGAAPMDPKSKKLDDPLNKKFLEDPKIEFQIKNCLPLSNIEPKNYQIIYFAGGHGTMWDFPENREISRIVSSIYENGGIVAAVCHGPCALINVKLSNGKYLIDGKKINSFTNEEEENVGLSEVVPFLLESKLRERGALFESGKKWENKVVISERLLTGQNPQSALSLGEKIAELAKEIILK